MAVAQEPTPETLHRRRRPGTPSGWLQPLAPAARIVLLFLLLPVFPAPRSVRAVQAGQGLPAATSAADLEIVDCLLPGVQRRLGRRNVYTTARRPSRTTARDCQIRGGEYSAYDRATLVCALQVWLAAAEAGSAEAQTIVGELYEGGVDRAPDVASAVAWYEKAVAQGDRRAMINLASLLERGGGVAQDRARAAALYAQALGVPGAQATLAQAAVAPAAPATDPERPDAAATPSIELIDPRALQVRGTKEVRLRTRSTEARTVVGQIAAPGGLRSFTVNGDDHTAKVTGNGVFSVPVTLTGERTAVVLRAIDHGGRAGEAQLTFVLGAEPEAVEPRRGARRGGDHALLIANNDYRTWAKLETPIADARALAELLRTRYGFASVRVLENANRLDLLQALEDTNAVLAANDNLLVYYAGHGFLEQSDKQLEPEMYWIPVDGERARTANWISTNEIARHLNRIEARAVLVIADSCFAGWLVGAAAAEPDEPAALRSYLDQASRRVARLALTSGSLQPVLDEGGGEHSVFAAQLLEVLSVNADLLSGHRLYRLLYARVSEVTRRIASGVGSSFEQEPDFAGQRRSRHEGGEFFLEPAARPAEAGAP